MTSQPRDDSSWAVSSHLLDGNVCHEVAQFTPQDGNRHSHPWPFKSNASKVTVPWQRGDISHVPQPTSGHQHRTCAGTQRAYGAHCGRGYTAWSSEGGHSLTHESHGQSEWARSSTWICGANTFQCVQGGGQLKKYRWQTRWICSWSFLILFASSIRSCGPPELHRSTPLLSWCVLSIFIPVVAFTMLWVQMFSGKHIFSHCLPEMNETWTSSLQTD